MAYTLQQLEALKNAIASGVHSVNYGDKTVTYRSLSDMLKVKSAMEAELFGAKSRRKLVSVDRGYFKKG